MADDSADRNLCAAWGRVRVAMNWSAEAVIDLLLPRRCYCCGSAPDGHSPLCASCWSTLSKPQGPVCFACSSGDTLSGSRAAGGDCKIASHRFYRVSAGFLMRGAGAALIHSLKYEGVRSAAGHVADRMKRAWESTGLGGADLLVPVPLHERRERLRGYNQSLLLAEELTKATGVVSAANLLRRARHTRAQVGLGAGGRRKNVEGAFRAVSPKAVEGRRVLLIDDVATTGATLRACTEVMIRCGARSVGGLVGALS